MRRSTSILKNLYWQLLQSITSSAQEDSEARTAANPTLSITATSTIQVVSVQQDHFDDSLKSQLYFFKHHTKTSVHLQALVQAQFYNSEADSLITLAYERLHTTLNSCQRIGLSDNSILSGSINDSILGDRVLHFTVTRHSLAPPVTCHSLASLVTYNKGMVMHCASPVVQVSWSEGESVC